MMMSMMIIMDGDDDDDDDHDDDHHHADNDNDDSLHMYTNIGYICFRLFYMIYIYIHIPTRSLSFAEVVAAGKSGFPELPSVSAMLDDSTHTLSGISQQAQKLQQQMLEVQQEKWSGFS